MKTEFAVTLFRGARAVGCHICQSAEEAREWAQLWRSHGEGHTATTEERERVLSAGSQAVPAEEYLTQGLGG